MKVYVLAVLLILSISCVKSRGISLEDPSDEITKQFNVFPSNNSGGQFVQFWDSLYDDDNPNLESTPFYR